MAARRSFSGGGFQIHPVVAVHCLITSLLEPCRSIENRQSKIQNRYPYNPLPPNYLQYFYGESMKSLDKITLCGIITIVEGMELWGVGAYDY